MTIDKNNTIVIERVANGYLVRPQIDPGLPYCINGFMVFQATGDAGDPATLLGWIKGHFAATPADGAGGT